MTYKKGSDQVVGSYRQITVNVDAKGKKTYTDSLGNTYTNIDEGGGWKKFEKDGGLRW